MDPRHRIVARLLSGLVAGMAGLAHSSVVVCRSYVVGSSVVVGSRAAGDRIGNIHRPCRRVLVGRLDLTLLRMLTMSRSMDTE